MGSYDISDRGITKSKQAGSPTEGLPFTGTSFLSSVTVPSTYFLAKEVAQ